MRKEIMDMIFHKNTYERIMSNNIIYLAFT